MGPMSQVVVIGAGLAGLAAAVRLATRGHTVQIVDPARAPGGPLAPIQTPHGQFAATPNRLILPAPLRDLFNRTGTALEQVVPLHPAEPMATVRIPGLPDLELPGAGVGASVQSVTEQVGAKLGASWRQALLQGGQRWAVLRDDPDSSDPRRADPPAITALARACALAAGASGGTPAEARMLAYLGATFGVWQVAGGLPALAAALAGRAELRGAQLLLGTQPRRLVVALGQVVGVELADGEVLPADVVVLERRFSAVATGLSQTADPGLLHGSVRAVAEPWPGPPAGTQWLFLSVPRRRRWAGGSTGPQLAAWADEAAPELVQVWASTGRGPDPISAARWALHQHGLPAHVLWGQREPLPPPPPIGTPSGLHVLGDPAAVASTSVPWAGFAVPTWTPPSGQVLAADIVAAKIGRG